jgi:hypothetical protein
MDLALLDTIVPEVRCRTPSMYFSMIDTASLAYPGVLAFVANGLASVVASGRLLRKL